MANTKTHPILDEVLDLMVVLVLVVLVDLLDLLEPVGDVLQQLIVVCHVLSHYCDPSLTWFVGADRGRFRAIDDLQWSVV